jgi:hypothetical protein
MFGLDLDRALGAAAGFVSGAAEGLGDGLGDAAADGGGLMQAAADWVAEHPISVATVPGTSTLDVELDGADYLAELDGTGLRVWSDEDDDGTGDALLFGGSAELVPEGLRLTYDADGDGTPETQVAVLTPETTLGSLVSLFL